MKVFFRTDASLEIGTGHVMRCLTLAEALRDQGAICCFVCRNLTGNLIELIRIHGFEVVILPELDFSQANLIQKRITNEKVLNHADWLGSDWQADAKQTKSALLGTVADWLIVDHYSLDVRWETVLKSHTKKIMVIDDLADRSHDCDLLLDQNLGRTLQDYMDLAPPNCKFLIGPRYALLRPEFSKMREYSLDRRVSPQLKNLLITMGGVDKDNATGQVLSALGGCFLPADCQITVVMGLHSPWLTHVRKQAGLMPWRTEVMVNIRNMAMIMADSDLAIGAAGSTSWERCCLGLPTLLLILADNQIEGAKALDNFGSCLLLGHTRDIAIHFSRILQSVRHKDKLLNMQNACKDVTDGNGTSYVIRHIVEGYTHENYRSL